METIREFRHLEQLFLFRNALTNVGFQDFRHLENLKTLFLDESQLLSDLSPIQLLGNLESLNIDLIPIKNEDLHILLDLTNLTQLSISGCNSLYSTQFLTKLQNLKTIDLSKWDITSVFDLSLLTQLQYLVLDECVKIEKLDELSSLIKLNYLSVEHCCQMKTDWFQKLTTLKELDELEISGCENITTEAFKYFPLLIKNLNVYENWDKAILDQLNGLNLDWEGKPTQKKEENQTLGWDGKSSRFVFFFSICLFFLFFCPFVIFFSICLFFLCFFFGSSRNFTFVFPFFFLFMMFTFKIFYLVSLSFSFFGFFFLKWK